MPARRLTCNRVINGWRYGHKIRWSDSSAFVFWIAGPSWATAVVAMDFVSLHQDAPCGKAHPGGRLLASEAFAQLVAEGVTVSAVADVSSGQCPSPPSSRRNTGASI